MAGLRRCSTTLLTGLRPPARRYILSQVPSRISIATRTGTTKNLRFSSSSSSAFFHDTPRTIWGLLRRHAVWAIPVAGGVALYFTPQEKSIIPTIFASSSVIPYPSPNAVIQVEPSIFSPQEPDRSIPAQIIYLINEYLWEPILTAGRFVHLAYIFLPVIICSPMLLVGRPEKKLKGDRWGAVWWYELLVLKMQAAGPTFIKLSQWAASRADLFPTLLCDRLGALHSRGKPHHIKHTKKVIEKAFERPFDEIFEEFNETPIGTGAIAQVYRATLKQDLIPPSFLGPRRIMSHSNPSSVISPPPSIPTASVAIKVLHPRVRKTISRDLSIMMFFAKALGMLPGMEWLSLPDEVNVFGSMMSQQLDLRNEADNLLTFEKNFSSRTVPVTFPRPLKVWSTSNLLVEEFENALPLELFLKNGGGPYDSQMATVGLDAFLNMLLLDNFVHADLHPGNIMIKFIKPPTTLVLLKSLFSNLFSTPKHPPLTPADERESDSVVSTLRNMAKNRKDWLNKLDTLFKDGYTPEIVFIDAGLVTTLSATNRQNFLDLFHAIAQFDGYLTGQLMVSRSRTPELAIDAEHFALKMQHIVLSVKRKTFSLGQIKISDILRDVLRAVREHHVRLEGDFVNTVISVLLLEGIGRRLDPTLDLFQSALPILRQLGGTMAAEEGKKRQMPSSDLGALLKVWVWMEARQLISSAIVNADDMIRYDWLTPCI